MFLVSYSHAASVNVMNVVSIMSHLPLSRLDVKAEVCHNNCFRTGFLITRPHQPLVVNQVALPINSHHWLSQKLTGQSNKESHSVYRKFMK